MPAMDNGQDEENEGSLAYSCGPDWDAIECGAFGLSLEEVDLNRSAIELLNHKWTTRCHPALSLARKLSLLGGCAAALARLSATGQVRGGTRTTAGNGITP